MGLRSPRQTVGWICRRHRCADNRGRDNEVIMDSRFMQRWSMRVPVIQAPMGGGPTTPALVAAVCEAGGMGSVAAAYLSPGQIDRDLREVKSLTSRPFAVNLFSPAADQPLRGDVAAVTALLAREHERLGLSPPTLPPTPKEDFDAQLDSVLAHGVPILSFTFGLLPEPRMKQLRDRGIYTIGTATTVREAIALEQAGCDAVVVQGAEAGAHRGTFLGTAESSLIGTMALVPQAVDAVKIPVIASGGIMDGRGVVAAQALGAAAVQMGTAFLNCDEAATSATYRRALEHASEDQTVVTDVFSGRAARGIRNRFIDMMANANLTPLSYPWQNAFTRELRKAAASHEDAGLLSLWVGQGVRMMQTGSAAEIVARIEAQMASVRASL
jgi:nitronate monooxygenase